MGIASNCLKSEDKNACEIKKGFCYYTRHMRWIYMLFAMMPIMQKSNGSFTFKFFSWRMVYSFIFHLTVTWFFATYAFSYRARKLVQMTDFDGFIFNLMFLSFCKMQYFYPICGWLASKEIAVYHNMWIDFEAKYSSLIKKPLLDSSLEGISKRYICNSLFATIMLIFGQLFFLPTYTFQECMGYISSTIAFYFFIGLIQLNCNAIEKASDLLLENLRMSLSKDVLTQDTVIILKSLWLDLSNITQKLGAVFSNYIIVMILSSIIDVIISGYGYFCCLLTRISKTTDTVEIFSEGELGLFIALMVSWLFLVYICNLCYNTNIKMEEPFTDILWMATTDSHHPKVVQEIESFLCAIRNNPPVISIYNFVPMNRKLITKMFSIIITNLIVLIQFKIGFNHVTKNKVSAN